MSINVHLSACGGRGLEDLMTVNLAKYKPTGGHVAIRRIDLDSCTNDMVNYLQVCRGVLFSQSSNGIKLQINAIILKK